MPKKVMGKTLNTVKRPIRLKDLRRATDEGAKRAASPDDLQYDADVDTSDTELESVDPNERERSHRMIRLPLRSDDETMGRRLLVTGGATVPFVGLLEEATSAEFLQTLRAQGFTHVYLQCGSVHDQILARLNSDGRGSGLEMETFDFCRDLKSLFKEHCRGQKCVQPAGVVMGHAGTGTIGDALEVDCALIIVANSTLMDDHQTAFATEMAAEHPTIVQGKLGNLTTSISEAMEVIQENKLDDLDPYEELSLPSEPALTFIDEVIAGATRPESQVGILGRCIIQ
ncbi:UDP-N-acetylglucosamine transferase subunit alg13 [Diaporthe helianthi]|uniref:UDP-N-acetylglucosamine transferase subunit ALG13 n=1 Tax=Diaporthe helianthi TaxID=158607 RepID=A0A2P5HYS5_DIAHE|nr:UDP-N-acetylglucosamine transferase subunit alg13 [Diaporthe helianthi]